jgi:hypothetical protein
VSSLGKFGILTGRLGEQYFMAGMVVSSSKRPRSPSLEEEDDMDVSGEGEEHDSLDAARSHPRPPSTNAARAGVTSAISRPRKRTRREESETSEAAKVRAARIGHEEKERLRATKPRTPQSTNRNTPKGMKEKVTKAMEKQGARPRLDAQGSSLSFFLALTCSRVEADLFGLL